RPPDGCALPRAQHREVQPGDLPVQLFGGAAASNDLGVRSAQLFNVGEGTVFVVVVSDQDSVGGVDGSRDAARVDINQRTGVNSEAAMSQPLNLVNHR